MTSNFKTASKNVIVSWRKLLPVNKQSNPSGAERKLRIKQTPPFKFEWRVVRRISDIHV
jgi:hypothetical protein